MSPPLRKLRGVFPCVSSCACASRPCLRSSTKDTIRHSLRIPLRLSILPLDATHVLIDSSRSISANPRAHNGQETLKEKKKKESSLLFFLTVNVTLNQKNSLYNVFTAQSVSVLKAVRFSIRSEDLLITVGAALGGVVRRSGWCFVINTSLINKNLWSQVPLEVSGTRGQFHRRLRHLATHTQT